MPSTGSLRHMFVTQRLQFFTAMRYICDSFLYALALNNDWYSAVVVVGAALYHYYAIQSLEARFETTVEKMLDKREQGSKAFIKEAIKESETNVLRRLLGR